MKSLHLLFTSLIIAICLMLPSMTAAQSADEPMVRAILFFSPNCGHCHRVINEVLLPMVDEYEGQLQIVGIDTSQAVGSELYQAAIEQYQITAERRGVPTLVIGDVVLVGGFEIPDQFPALVKDGLKTGNIEWPDIPGLDQLLSETQPEPSPTAVPTTAANLIPISTPIPDVANTPVVAAVNIDGGATPRNGDVHPFSADPAGFTLASVVLIGMVTAFGYTAWRITRPHARQQIIQLFSPTRVPANSATSIIPLLCLVGLGVALYLAYVEVNHVEAVCGPVGDCNTVQTSDYALFLGVPVAVWGVLNYLVLATLWVGQRYMVGRLANLSLLGLIGFTLFGVLFSIYLTCLELFAIHAICAWCLSSAVTVTFLMLLVAIPVTDRISATRCSVISGST